MGGRPGNRLESRNLHDRPDRGGELWHRQDEHLCPIQKSTHARANNQVHGNKYCCILGKHDLEILPARIVHRRFVGVLMDWDSYLLFPEILFTNRTNLWVYILRLRGKQLKLLTLFNKYAGT